MMKTTTLTPTKETLTPTETLKYHLIVLLILGTAIVLRSMATQDSRHAQETLRGTTPTESVECDVE